VFAAEHGRESIHVAPWPDATELADAGAPADPASFATAAAALAAIHKAKADAEVGIGREVERLVLRASPASRARLERVRGDLLAAARCHEGVLEEDPALGDDAFEVAEIAFAARPAQG
jgi:hypothetical protein